MKVSPLILPLVVVLAITDNLKLYLITYFVMAIHEFSHFAVAKLIGLKTGDIIFSPFGINLRLRSRIINSLAEEIILYCSGPLVNGVLALISIFFNNIIFYRLNIALFIMNLLPVIPLDGGMIVLRLLSYRYGQKTAKRVLNAFSVIFGVMMLVLSVFMMIRGKINISMFIISVLFIGNILTGKEKYNQDLIQSLISREKRTNKVKLTVIDNTHSVIDTINEFSPTQTVFAVVFDKNGSVDKILSEREIIEKYYCENLTLQGV